MAAVGSNYSQPVMVDGYVCWNCKQVAEAKKGENPAQPAGPGGAAPTTSSSRPGAVVFGGTLAGPNGAGASSTGPATPSPSTGAMVDLMA